MIRSDFMCGRGTPAIPLLAWWIALFGLASAIRAAPIRTWSIDFTESGEPDRWQLSGISRDSDPRRGPPSEQIRWAQVPRNASSRSRGKVLEVSASSKLSVETYFSIFRAFPQEFRPDPSNDLVLEWEWQIDDTELSGAVSLAVLRTNPDGSELDTCFGVDGHTRFTAGWPVLFDPADRWVHHRISFNSEACPADSREPKQAIGVVLILVSPVRQTIDLASLKIEEWRHGELAADPVFRPHHAPPPDLPFEPLPFDQLRRSTAGAIEDLDGDGLPELLVLERRGYSHLYHNTGDSKLEEITGRAGLNQPSMGTGAMFIDLDADGDRDLAITSEFDVPRFFENIGDLRFRERLLVSDRQLSFWYGVAADDIDRDGDPDLLFVSPMESHFLFLRNRGEWHFEAGPLLDDRSLVQHGELNFSASFADVDNDAWPDLFLGREYLFRNFTGQLELDPRPWKAVNRIQTEGGVFADFTGDSRLDLLILRDSTEDPRGSSRLFEGTQSGELVESTKGAGLPTLESAEVALAEDFDNDGDLDLYLCQRNRPNYLLLNDGHGHFVDATEGSGFSETGGCDSALAADMNGDGGLDVVILRYGSSPALLLNQLVRGRWLGVMLEGQPGTDAIGASVRILDYRSREPITVRWVRRGQGFGSVGPAELRFGLGSRQLVDVEVRFPAGETRILKGVPGGSTRLVEESRGGVLSPVRRWIRETCWPFSQSVRRQLPASSLLAVLIAGLAFLTALPLLVKRWRAPSLLLWAAGGLATALLGSMPGRGLAGSPLALWVLGTVASVGISAAGISLMGLVSQWRQARARVPQREDLIRFTQDFRHAGLEARTLLAIHVRAQNLFLASEPHPSFLASLRELAAGYPSATGAKLRALLTLSRAAFPDLDEAAKLAETEHRLQDLLIRLTGLGEEPEPLRRWQEQLLPILQTTQAALTALLARLDFLCSCDVRAVLREACAAHAEALRRGGVDLAIHEDKGGIARALITPDALLMVLDNLFTNALAALATREARRIEIELSQGDQEITLRFRDNGLGVPPNLVEKIFDYGVSTRPEGKGYGLPRSRELLGHFGGGMVLEAAAVGATFLVTLRRVT